MILKRIFTKRALPGVLRGKGSITLDKVMENAIKASAVQRSGKLILV